MRKIDKVMQKNIENIIFLWLDAYLTFISFL